MTECCEVLIVDDEPVVGERLKAIIEKDGHRVEAFVDPLVAVSRLMEKAFDIVIADIRMKQMDGIQVMEKVLEKSKHTRVIMITGYATVALARDALRKGAFDFIAKPFKLKEIRRAIERARESLAAGSDPEEGRSA